MIWTNLHLQYHLSVTANTVMLSLFLSLFPENIKTKQLKLLVHSLRKEERFLNCCSCDNL